jgi:hypothetical protein
MKLFIILLIITLFSCSYPDIDSVPDFQDLKLSQEELYDLCQLSSNDKKDIDACIEEKLKNL